MSAQGFWKKSVGEYPTKEERKVLKAEGVDMKDRKALIAATAELREKNKPIPAPPKPTQEELLSEILVELKKQNTESEVVVETKKSKKTK